MSMTLASAAMGGAAMIGGAVVGGAAIRGVGSIRNKILFRNINQGSKIDCDPSPIYTDQEAEAYASGHEHEMIKEHYWGRTNLGHRIMCHVLAYLNNQEGLNNDWDTDWKKCANAFSRALGLCTMYEVTNDNAVLSDFKFKPGEMCYPIVTMSSGLDAFNRYGLKGVTVNDLLSVFTWYTEVPVSVDVEETVDVIDVEEQVINNTNTALTVIDVDPDELEPIDVEAEEIEPEEVDDNRTVAITFDPEKMVLFTDSEKVIEATHAQKKKIKELFGDLIQGDYQLNRIKSGVIECVLNLDNGGFVTYIIDPNLYVGNGYNVICPTSTNGDIPVHESEKEILKKVFDNQYALKGQKYVLSPEETQQCMSHMFMNYHIYDVIDMSNMSERFKKLSKDEFQKLGKKFSFIINAIPREFLGRLRVSEWKGIDQFKLVSDVKCKSPFPGETLENVTGIAVEVSGDNVTLTINNNVMSYTITNYGVL